MDWTPTATPPLPDPILRLAYWMREAMGEAENFYAFGFAADGQNVETVIVLVGGLTVDQRIAQIDAEIETIQAARPPVPSRLTSPRPKLDLRGLLAHADVPRTPVGLVAAERASQCAARDVYATFGPLRVRFDDPRLGASYALSVLHADDDDRRRRICAAQRRHLRARWGGPV